MIRFRHSEQRTDAPSCCARQMLRKLLWCKGKERVFTLGDIMATYTKAERFLGLAIMIFMC